MDYKIFCLQDDFYLADPIKRYFNGLDLNCDIQIIELLNGGINNQNEINLNPSVQYIFITNDDSCENTEFNILVKKAIKISENTVIFLQNEPVKAYPYTRGIIRKLPVDGGLGLDDMKAIMNSPGYENIGQFIDFAAIAMEGMDSAISIGRNDRIYNPLALLDPANNYNPQVQRGLRYYTGNGVPQDKERAESLFQKAASENPQDAFAFYFLGMCRLEKLHDFSSDAEISPVLSDFNHAYDLGCKEAIWPLAETMGRLPEKRDEAREILKNLVNSGYPEANYQLGIIEEFEENYDNSIDYYSELAENGNPIAQNAIGRLYAEGLGVNQDLDKAIQWFELAASQGLIQAKSNLGIAYLATENEDLMSQAPELIEEAASAGYKSAVNALDMINSARNEEAVAAEENEESSVSSGLESFMRGLDLPSLARYAKQIMWDRNDPGMKL